MHLSRRIGIPGLLKIIGAKELIACDSCTGHQKFHEEYRSSGKLEDRGTYEVHTNNLDNTLSRIKNYNHNN